MGIGNWINRLRSWVSKSNKEEEYTSNTDVLVLLDAEDWNPVPGDFTGIVIVENDIQYPYHFPIRLGSSRLHQTLLQSGIYYFNNGWLHRENGPAIHLRCGENQWYLDGEKVSAMEVFEQLTDVEKEKVMWNINEWK